MICEFCSSELSGGHTSMKDETFVCKTGCGLSCSSCGQLPKRDGYCFACKRNETIIRRMMNKLGC